MLFNNVPLRTRRALLPYRLCTVITPFWFLTEHLWLALTPFWLSTGNMIITNGSVVCTMLQWIIWQIQLVKLVFYINFIFRDSVKDVHTPHNNIFYNIVNAWWWLIWQIIIKFAVYDPKNPKIFHKVSHPVIHIKWK